MKLRSKQFILTLFFLIILTGCDDKNTNNSPPTAEAFGVETTTNHNISIDLSSHITDVDNDADFSTLSISQEPAHGTLEILSGGILFYTPDSDYTGSDSFSYSVSDSEGNLSNNAVVSITVLFTNPFVSLNYYYVDFENGVDSNDGKTPETSWKHAPGDSNATGIPAEIELQPGDNVSFKGGVIYRGNIDIPESGNIEEPITYSGNSWPGLENTQAIIDGGDTLSGWQPCESVEACGGNANWENIFYTYAPADITSYTANMHEINYSTDEDEFLWIAQEPEPTDRYFMDDKDGFFVVEHEDLTRTSIVDAGFFTQVSSDHWNNSTVYVWVNPNRVELREIEAVITRSDIDDWDALLEIIKIENSDNFPASVINELFNSDDLETIRACDDGDSLSDFLKDIIISILNDIRTDTEFYLSNASFITISDGTDVNTRLGDLISENIFQDENGQLSENLSTADIKKIRSFNISILKLILSPIIVKNNIDTGFIPEKNMITFDDLGEQAIYPDGRAQRYSIYNSIHALDSQGEFYFNNTEETDNTHKVYLWPRDDQELSSRISISVREYGFNLGNHDYIIIEGFQVFKHSGDNLRNGVGIGTVTGASSETNGVIIRDNLITHNRHVSSGYGGIYISASINSLIENNSVIDNPKNKGIFAPGAVNTVIKDNIITRSGSTSLTIYNGSNCMITGNTITESNGSHANGITIYIASTNILVADNTIYNCGSPITFQDSGNLYFINNLIDAGENDSNVNEWGCTSRGPWATGDIWFFHNAFLKNNRNAALNIGKNPGNSYCVMNNILDGMSGSTINDDGNWTDNPRFNQDYNIYTGLLWSQTSSYNWSLATHEIVETDLDIIFNGPDSHDFRLGSESPAINSGNSIQNFLNQLKPIFPDYNFNKDIDGNNRPNGSAVDIGPYEY